MKKKNVEVVTAVRVYGKTYRSAHSATDAFASSIANNFVWKDIKKNPEKYAYVEYKIVVDNFNPSRAFKNWNFECVNYGMSNMKLTPKGEAGFKLYNSRLETLRKKAYRRSKPIFEKILKRK